MYFGHMLHRIEGYAEYGVYQYSEYADAYKKAYPVDKQKRLFLTSLKQYVSDEAAFDSDLPNAYKAERKKDILIFIDRLDLLISNNFYLHQAEQFEYTNYQ